MGSSPESKSPIIALGRQHSRSPSPIGPQSRDALSSPFSRFNGGPAPSPIIPLRRQSPVRAQIMPVYNPLPPRIKMSPRSITQAPAELINRLIADEQLRQKNLRVLREQSLQEAEQRRLDFQASQLPPILTPRRRAAQAAQSIDINAPFRARMSSFEIGGPVIFTLDDGTVIDMGVNDIDDAIKLISRYDNKGVVIYSILGVVPEFKMMITEDGRIIHMSPPKNGGRTRARKMGRKGRKGTNKRRRYIVAKTRRQRPRRRGNKPPRTLRN